MNVLAADIGGTHCRLAMASLRAGRADLNHVHRYVNADHGSLVEILQGYLEQLDQDHAPLPRIACLAVAGPTDGRQVHFTNLDWHIDASDLETATGLERVSLVNDFTAVGWGLNILGTEDLAILQAGLPQANGVKVAAGAGTGLGVSIAVWQDGVHRPLPTEGGHIGFAPLDPEQDRLLAFMRGLYGRVSVERLLSGPGIVDLYRFCAHEAGESAPALLESEIPARAISQAALAGKDALARRALGLFATIYGQVAGDIALMTRAQGGIYLAGGIPPQILPILKGPEFLAGFHAKGRFSDWMHSVPVAVVLDSDIGLKGAAMAAVSQ